MEGHMHQKNVFMDHEGNEWYERNKSAILGKTLDCDPWNIWAAILPGYWR